MKWRHFNFSYFSTVSSDSSLLLVPLHDVDNGSDWRPLPSSAMMITTRSQMQHGNETWQPEKIERGAGQKLTLSPICTMRFGRSQSINRNVCITKSRRIQRVVQNRTTFSFYSIRRVRVYWELPWSGRGLIKSGRKAWPKGGNFEFVASLCQLQVEQVYRLWGEKGDI